MSDHTLRDTFFVAISGTMIVLGILVLAYNNALGGISTVPLEDACEPIDKQVTITGFDTQKTGTWIFEEDHYYMILNDSKKYEILEYYYDLLSVNMTLYKTNCTYAYAFKNDEGEFEFFSTW